MNEIQELHSALDSLSPAGLSYQEWCTVGMALKEAGQPVSLWEDWSRRDAGRYHPGECARKWESFHGSGTPVTVSSIFALARAHGWQGLSDRELNWNDEIEARPLVDPGWIEAEEADALPIPQDWDPAGQLIQYLQALFEPAENVGYVTESWEKDGKWLPSRGSWSRTAGELIQELSACGGDLGKVLGDWQPAAGAWIRFNPLDGKGCKNDNVTEYRFALVESDSVPLPKQKALMEALQLPCAALVYSGGKSIHAIVRVDAPDYAEYRRRVEYLYEVCRKNGLEPDTQNKNPSRLSRMPGITRGDRRQYLLGVNLGQPSFEAWQAWVEGQTDDLPDTESLAASWGQLPELSPPLIEGVLRQGHKMLLAGPSKAGKSFALIELSICIAEGARWLGRWACAPGRVLYINLELDRASCLPRFAAVYQALGLPPAPGVRIDRWNLRGASVPMDKLAPKLIRRAKNRDYIAVILDPIYKVLTGDENAADQMAKFCNQFDLVCRQLGCAVVYCHHHSKGAQGGKRSMDRASGSGVFARDPDALLDMTELIPTEAIRKQLENRAACAACAAELDRRGLSDVYTRDDACSRAKMLELCRQQIAPAQLPALDRAIDAACAAARARTAWRIEGTLREFARFDPVNLWFDYPVHRLDTGLLEDLNPESAAQQLGRAGAAARWPGGKEESAKRSRKELSAAFDACLMDGQVTIYALAEYMDLKPDTIKRRLRADGGYWIDGEQVGRREPGSAG